MYKNTLEILKGCLVREKSTRDELFDERARQTIQRKTRGGVAEGDKLGREAAAQHVFLQVQIRRFLIGSGMVQGRKSRGNKRRRAAGPGSRAAQRSRIAVQKSGAAGQSKGG